MGDELVAPASIPASSAGPRDEAMLHRYLDKPDSGSQLDQDVQPGSRPSPYQLLSQHSSLPGWLQRPFWSLAQLQLVQQLYSGYASRVFKAVDKLSWRHVCVKLYQLDKLDELSRHQILREVSIHSAVHHENIISLYAAFQEDNQIVLVEEYADGGDLFQIMKRYQGRRLRERVAVQCVIKPCLHAVAYLHELGVVHRDIKPENLLFTKDMKLKLADFGLAIDLNDERAVTRLGTLEFMAPEVLRCPNKVTPADNKDRLDVAYGPQVDAWSIGAMGYELLTGRAPFQGKDAWESVNKIMHSQPQLPAWLSAPARSFICEALAKFPGDRPTIADMLRHPWILGSIRARRDSAPAALSVVDSLFRTQLGFLSDAASNSAASEGGQSEDTPLTASDQ